jgi:hypothetical protein
MAERIEIYKHDRLGFGNPDELVYEQEDVIGHVLALVVKHPDGAITLERDIAVSADNAEDNELAESVVKAIEEKLNEAFPDPNKPEPSKLWVPD